MSFERPKLKAIIDRLDADIQSRLTVPQLRHSNAKVYGRVLAGAAHGLYGLSSTSASNAFSIRPKTSIWIDGLRYSA